jgi:hypothetical protein
MRQERKLVELSETQAAAGGTPSAEYVRANNLSRWASWAMALLVIVTIYFMTVHA